MPNDITDDEARLALTSIETRRRQVIAEIDMPRWYWWGLALGWVVLGVITDSDRPWLIAVATLVFGAVHASVAHRVLSGRHRSPQLSVRADVVGHYVPAIVIGFLLGLAAVTVGLSLLAMADGAGHPVTMASVVVGVALVCGGPRLMAAVRRRAERKAVAA
jgi:hypothetical protein